jgi:hypothetical protein
MLFLKCLIAIPSSCSYQRNKRRSDSFSEENQTLPDSFCIENSPLKDFSIYVENGAFPYDSSNPPSVNKSVMNNDSNDGCVLLPINLGEEFERMVCSDKVSKTPKTEPQELPSSRPFQEIGTKSAIMVKQQQEDMENMNIYLDRTTKALKNVMNHAKFSEDFVEAFERSKSDWNKMLERLSSETGTFKKCAASTLSSSSLPIISKGSTSTSSTNKQPIPSCNYDVNRRKDTATDHWREGCFAATAEGSTFGKNYDSLKDCRDEFQFLEPPTHGKLNVDEPSRRRQKRRNQSSSLDGFGANAPECMRDTFLTVSEGVSSMVAEAKKVRPRDVLTLVDCSQCADDISEPHELEVLPRRPLNHSWFSFDENDSISKLTSPQDLSNSLNNTLNGLDLSRDLTAIPKVDEINDDDGPYIL